MDTTEKNLSERQKEIDYFLSLSNEDAREYTKVKLAKKLWTFKQSFDAMEYWRTQNKADWAKTKQAERKVTPEQVQLVFGKSTPESLSGDLNKLMEQRGI